MIEGRITADIRRFWGKYRGHVVDNKDPEKLGRIKALVPAVDGMASAWALPCTPYAGAGVGMLFLPPVGALVWIEFERGDPTFPIWVGGFWGRAADVPLVYATNADDPALVKVVKTANATLMLDDTASTGKVQVKLDKPAVDQHPVTLTFDSQGATLETGVCTMTMVPTDGVTTKVSQAIIEQTPSAITATAATITQKATPTTVETSTSGVTVSAPQFISTLQGPFSVTGPESSITGQFAVTGVSTLTGATTITGEAIIAGALTVAGMTTMSGGAAILGAGTIDGAPIL